jgi:hypothetical protein
MAIRRRELHPDDIFRTRSGHEIPVVSEEQYLAQLVDLGRFQLFAGGVVSALVQRAPTDLPNEMVTVGAVLEWKDRTDAKSQPEPEADSRAVPRDLLPTDGSDWTPLPADPEPEEPVHEEEAAPARAAVPAPPASGDGIGDGLEGIDPEAEDESEIPETLRS